MTWRGVALILCCSAGGCSELEPAEGHVVVYLDTDAPLPEAPEHAARVEGEDTLTVPPLFDRLRVSLLRNGYPIAGTSREVELSTELLGDGPLSFGVVPERPTERAVLELTLFRVAQSASSFAPELTGLNARISLPPAKKKGGRSAYFFLSAEDTGLRLGSNEPLEVEESAVPSPGARQTWLRALPVGCKSPPEEDEVCVRSGAFWMGDPKLRGNADLGDSDRERLTAMSPFFVDRHEVTVAQFRLFWTSVLEGAVVEGDTLIPPPTYSGATDGSEQDDFATYTLEPGDHDQLPVNGVTWATARAYCISKGKDLPTEAMYEYVASGLGMEWDYPWGFDVPECADSVIARAGYGHYSNFSGVCRGPGSIGGPEPVASTPRDTIAIDTQGAVVSDLAGNLTEWTRDSYREQPGANELVGIAVDPVVTSENLEHGRVVKGGSWRGGLVEARAGARSQRPPEVANRSVGFRCARTD